MSYLMILLLSAVYSFISFTALLSKHLKLKLYLFLFVFLFILHFIGNISIGQWITLFIVTSSCLTIYIGSGRNLLDVILSLTGYLIGVFVNHLFSVPLSFLGIPLITIQEQYYIPFLTTVTLLSLLLLLIIRKFFIAPKLLILQNCPTKLLCSFLGELLIGISLLTINFIYGEAAQYPTEILTWNGIIITAITLSATVLFYSIYDILKRNYELSLQQQELSVMKDYTQRMENFYEEMRVFRHDYRNILSTMQYFIDSNDRDSLQKYFHEKIVPSGELLKDNGFIMGRLHMIADPALKSLIYTKLIAMENHHLHVTLELAEPVSNINMDTLTLCRILGILLDNAIEAAAETAEKIIQLSIICMDTCTTFIISNSTMPINRPVSTLFEQNFTTKNNHSGLGLYTVKEVVDSSLNVNMYTSYENNIFCQNLEILAQNECTAVLIQ